MILGAEALQRATIPLAGVQRRKVAPTAADISATARPYGVEVLSKDRILSCEDGLSLGGKMDRSDISPP
jgi:hypothetical protein